MTASDHGIRYVDPEVRSLNVIAKRFDIKEQEIAQNSSSIQLLDDITNIPEFLMSTNSDNQFEQQNSSDGHDKEEEHKNRKENFKMVIDLLLDVLSGSKSDDTNGEKESKNNEEIKEECNNFTFENATSKYKLDFKQKVAFEIMACSYILKTLQDEKITDESICSFFATDDNEQSKYLKNFTLLKE